MDTIGSVSAILGIALFALSIAKQLYEFIDTVHDAPDSVRAIARDAHALHAIMDSLRTILTERSVRSLVDRHPSFRQQVENLKGPIQHCYELLEGVITKLRPWLACQAKGIKRAAKRMRFYLSKSTVKDLVTRLDTTKATLNAAMTSVMFSFIALQTAQADMVIVYPLPTLRSRTSSTDLDIRRYPLALQDSPRMNSITLSTCLHSLIARGSDVANDHPTPAQEQPAPEPEPYSTNARRVMAPGWRSDRNIIRRLDRSRPNRLRSRAGMHRSLRFRDPGSEQSGMLGRQQCTKRQSANTVLSRRLKVKLQELRQATVAAANSRVVLVMCERIRAHAEYASWNDVSLIQVFVAVGGPIAIHVGMTAIPELHKRAMAFFKPKKTGTKNNHPIQCRDLQLRENMLPVNGSG